YIRKIKRKLNKSIISKIIPKFKLNYNKKGVINFIDVGSVGGLPEPWNSNANKVNFLLNFEPNESLKKGVNFMTYNTAVWEKEEVRPFYIYKGFKGTGSSLFKQNFEYVKQNFDILKERGSKRLANSWFERSKLIKTSTLKCRTIDSILKEEFPSTVFHFMKIDAQGAEYNILKGSENLLRSCTGLHLELFTIPLYEGIALMSTVENYLSKFGFQLVKTFPPHGSFNSQNDCLFLKKEKHPIYSPLIRKIYKID
ncbi:MAG: FkbM family methyltransferase, partial [Mariprofundus sp.]|nr:FkbM family methyltransferase [Mariprofundus sp.]